MGNQYLGNISAKMAQKAERGWLIFS